MNIRNFALERRFAGSEFALPYLLSCSDCDGLPLWELVNYADCETAQLWLELKLGYTQSQGHPLLRREIAALHGMGDPGDVLVAAPEEGIFLAMHAILRPGDHVVVTFPGYQSLYEVAREIGCQVTYWRPNEEEGWRFHPDVLRQLVREDTRLIVVNFPHNPTGYLPPVADFRSVVEIAREKKVYLFSDEMYRYLEHDPSARLPSAAVLYERAVSLSGMSKAFSLAGLRIGWVATQDRGLLTRMGALKDYPTICASATSEILALIGLRAREEIVSANLRKISRNLETLGAFMERRRERFRWVRPAAGTICFPRLRKDGAEALCRRAEEAGIMLLPSTAYGYGDRHVRIGFGREDMGECLERLDRLLG